MVVIQYHYEAAAPAWPQTKTMDIGTSAAPHHTLAYMKLRPPSRGSRYARAGSCLPQPRHPLYEAAARPDEPPYFNDAGRLYFTRWQNIASRSFERCFFGMGGAREGRSVPAHGASGEVTGV